MTQFNLEENNSIYNQIADVIRRRIVTGVYGHGEKLQPVRDLAMEFHVNPNTMQRALSELEREGYLITERTIGKYVTDDEQFISEKRTEQINSLISKFLVLLSDYGVTTTVLCDYLRAFNN